VTIASRDVELDGVTITKGHWLGLAEDRPVIAHDDFEDAAAAVADALLAGGSRSLLTLLVGADAPPLEPLLTRLADAYPDVEVDVQQGGQPHYHLFLSAE
jgi:dihydroxyacetone kinase-like predicted kinase